MRSSVNFHCCWSDASPAIIQSFNNSLPPEERIEFDIDGSICFSADPPSIIEVALQLSDAAKWFAGPAALMALKKVVESGKTLKDGIEGWIAIWKMIPLGSRKHLDVLKQIAEDAGTRNVQIKLSGRLKVDDDKACDISVQEDDPNNSALLLGALEPSLRRAVKGLLREDVSLSNEFQLELEAQGFALLWGDGKGEADQVCAFDLEGDRVGQVRGTDKLKLQRQKAIREMLTSLGLPAETKLEL